MMNTQDLSKLTYKELDKLSYQLARDHKLSFDDFFPNAPLSPEQKANKALGERLRAVMDERARRYDTEEAKIFMAERNAAYEAAKAEHERRYAADATYKAHVDDLWQEWARSEAHHEACEAYFTTVESRRGKVHSEHQTRLYALRQEYEVRLLDLARETQARLNNAGLAYEKRAEMLKREVKVRLPSLNLEYRERIRTMQFEYKVPLASLSCEWRDAMATKSEAWHTAGKARSAYMKAIGDDGNTFTQRTTKQSA
jgi:hypothetical protein